MRYHVKNIKLAPQGKKKIEWAEREMPVLRLIREKFHQQKPFKGIKISGCLHITSETANLARALQAGGAQVSLTASNPLSTQDDVAASIAQGFKIPVFAIKGEDRKTYYNHLNLALDQKPHITVDDGADLISLLHSKRSSLSKNILGSTEETTTGVVRLRALAKQGKLKFPIIAVNDAETKHLFDNRYGTGQSTIDGILRATNILLAGKVFVVCGYGMCGKGVSARARGMNARVIITEVNPVKALEAHMDGFEVMTMREAAKIGDIFVTVTGDREVITKDHFKNMKDGAIVANSGHFNIEINIKSLEKMSSKKREIRNNVSEYTLKRGKKINLLADGRLVNLAAAEGHPAQVMDMSFSGQALAAEYLVKNSKNLQKQVYKLPDELDHQIAIFKLKSLGVSIDKLTPGQKIYLTSWEVGT